MRTFIFDEVKGKVQGKVIIIEAENEKEAIEKFGADETIRYCEKFSKVYVTGVYELKEIVNGTNKDTDYIVHKAN